MGELGLHFVLYNVKFTKYYIMLNLLRMHIKVNDGNQTLLMVKVMVTLMMLIHLQ